MMLVLFDTVICPTVLWSLGLVTVMPLPVFIFPFVNLPYHLVLGNFSSFINVGAFSLLRPGMDIMRLLICPR